MTIPYKAFAMMREVKDELQKRLSTLTFTSGNDTDGAPTLALDDGSAASGEANAFIKITGYNWPLVKDALGLAQNVYVPLVIQLATEANKSGGSGADNLSPAQLLAVLGTLIVRGCRLEWYEEDFGTPPSVSTITSSKLKATWEDLYNPLTRGQ